MEIIRSRRRIYKIKEPAHYCDKEDDLAEIKADIKYLVKSWDDYKEEIKENTKFRIRGQALVAFVGTIAGFFGGVITWIITKTLGEK